MASLRYMQEWVTRKNDFLTLIRTDLNVTVRTRVEERGRNGTKGEEGRGNKATKLPRSHVILIIW